MRNSKASRRTAVALAIALLTTSASSANFSSPSANKVHTSALGVFTRYALFLVCRVEGGVWEARDGDHGEPSCHPPTVGVSDANIYERSVYAANDASCTPSRIHSDSGWTTGWIPIPPELHEYSDYQKGYINDSQVQEVRQIVVEYNINVLQNGQWVCDPETPKYRYFGFSRVSDRRHDFDGCYKRGDPVDVRTGETVARRDLSSEVGFPFVLSYGAMSVDAGNSGMGGAWRHNYSNVLRHTPADPENGTPETAVLNLGPGDLVVFLRGAQGQWENKSLRREQLIDVVDGGGKISGWWLKGKDGFLVFDKDGFLSSVEEKAGRFHAVKRYYPDLPPFSKVRQALIKNVEDNFGRSLAFSYDADLYLTSVSSGGSTVETTINHETRKLTGLVHSGKTISGYFYNDERFPDALTDIFDESQKALVSFSYGDGGQATGSTHAGGADSWGFAYSQSDSYKQTVVETDPLNAVRSWEFHRDYLGGGVYSRWRSPTLSQPPGSGCEQATQSLVHDNYGNVLRRDDFNEHRSCHAYALDRNVESFRLEGLSKADVCPVDLAAAQVDPLKSQRKVSTTWHPLWNLEAQRAEPKRITTTVYNGQQDPVDPKHPTLDCAPGAPLLSDGSKIVVVCKRYEQSTEDETGNLGFAAAATSTRSWSYAYSAQGQVTQKTDPRGKLTAYEYWADTAFAGNGNAARGHWLGDLMRVTNALGQKTEHLEYNKRGQALTTRYANGSQELREYHSRGWLSKVTLVPAGGGVGQVTQYDYFDTGLLKKVTQPDGSFAKYTWDDAHRLTDVVDSVWNKVHYELDNAGNRKSEEFRDPQGTLANTITRTFDALGRMSGSTGLQ